MQSACVREDGVCAYRIPESASALWRIVSFTAANTRRMFEVSVACVRLQKRRNVSKVFLKPFEGAHWENQRSWLVLRAAGTVYCSRPIDSCSHPEVHSSANSFSCFR